LFDVVKHKESVCKRGVPNFVKVFAVEQSVAQEYGVPLKTMRFSWNSAIVSPLEINQKLPPRFVFEGVAILK
jgi:hypothetical protein